MKISHSAAQKYQTCPRMYKYHYKDKIRPIYTSSALLFGDAIDKAINELVLKTENDPYEVFIKNWTQTSINKIDTYLPTATNIVYTNKDFDAGLLSSSDYEEIDKRITSGEIKKYVYEDLVDKKKSKGWESFSLDEKRFYNYHNWLSMKAKAKYFIEAYKEQIIPKITKVYKVQHPIAISNGEDEINGFIDLIVEMEGYEGPIILDNKTSSREYSWDAVQKSPQLALYQYVANEYNTNLAGFVVMIKNLTKEKTSVCKKCGNDGSKSRAKTCDAEVDTKRCHGEWTTTYKPKAVIQVLINIIKDDFKEIVIENFDDITKAIKAEIFPRNLDKCYDNYGSECPYLKYCITKKGCMDGLDKQEESK